MGVDLTAVALFNRTACWWILTSYARVVRERPSPESVVANDSLFPSVTGFSVLAKVPGEVSPKYLFIASTVSTK